jgi:hypothetical protein
MTHASMLKHFEVPITPLEGQVIWTLGKVQVRLISPILTAVFTGYKYLGSQTIYVSLKNRRIPWFLPVFKLRIKDLTHAVNKNRPKPRFFNRFLQRLYEIFTRGWVGGSLSVSMCVRF